MNIKELKEKAKWVRRKLFDVGVKCGQAHLGGALSSVEIVLALYNGGVLNISPDNPEEKDRFVYSKGHNPLAYYTILADNGFFTMEELEKYGTTEMPGHLDYHTNGVEMTNGSLGHGIGYGIGLAIAKKLDKKDDTIYILMGDTECNEGSVWEGAMFAAAKKLNNIVAIIDNNKFGVQELSTHYTGPGLLSEKWSSFGWNTYEVNGHNIKELLIVFEDIKKTKSEKPTMIIANTIKGKGISFMEGNPAWHHGIPKGEELKQAYEDLAEKKVEEIIAV